MLFGLRTCLLLLTAIHAGVIMCLAPQTVNLCKKKAQQHDSMLRGHLQRSPLSPVQEFLWDVCPRPLKALLPVNACYWLQGRIVNVSRRALYVLLASLASDQDCDMMTFWHTAWVNFWPLLTHQKVNTDKRHRDSLGKGWHCSNQCLSIQHK